MSTIPTLPETAAHYTLGRILDPNLIRDALTVDRGSNAYMIGDLSGTYWQGAEFYGAWRSQSHIAPFVKTQPVAIVLVYTPIDPPPLITWGDSEGIRALLGGLVNNADSTTGTLRAERLDKIDYHAALNHIDALRTLFDLTETLTMWRMIVTPDHFQNVAQMSTARRLNGSDASAIQDVYENRISPALLDGGIFYGVESNGMLVSVVGTHIISPQEGIGVVGYVFTRPEARGKGYATACTGAVTRALIDQGIGMVALNVRQDNPPAIRAYEKLGYVRHSALYEGSAQRKVK